MHAQGGHPIGRRILGLLHLVDLQPGIVPGHEVVLVAGALAGQGILAFGQVHYHDELPPGHSPTDVMGTCGSHNLLHLGGIHLDDIPLSVH